MELVPVESPADLGSMLDAQRDLFHRQAEQLQRIVVAQCRLTGVNPLSQEMAAGALSINIGKRPRDMLNPKAVKYMQSVFSVKDTIGKKETREISAVCGITLTQVRDYFSGQRSRVRKSIRLSRETPQKLNDPNPPEKCSPDPKDILENNKHAPVSCRDDKSSGELARAPDTVENHNGCPHKDISLLDCAENRINGECSTSSSQELIPDINLEDKKFLKNIFTLMRKEQTFSGQAKLMEWILQINNSAILFWFLTKGGATILASWLSLYSVEEQTSMILVIFKVLCHLPLHKASPLQLSSILETVNRLRFYRTPDISNKARFLLSRWSKMLVRNNAVKKSSLKSNGAHEELLREQRIGEILRSRTWQKEVDIPEEILALTQECSGSNRQLESKQVLKLLPPAGSNSSRKHGRIVSAAKTKERRKVLLVEQPDHVTGRNMPVSRAVPANRGRPVSADDIQKAKMRASLMQRKNGKTDAATHEKDLTKVKDKKLFSAFKRKVSAQNPSESSGDEARKSADVNVSQPPICILNDPNPGAMFQKMLEKLRSHQIPWQKPPEMAVNALWSLGSGENSKEVEVQIARNRREQEAINQKAEEIPENPKEPWDLEMDFDDSLTPEIPIEQLPDDDEEATAGAECASSSGMETNITCVAVSTVQGNLNMGTSTEILTVGHSMQFSQIEHASVANSMPFSSLAMYVGMGNSMPIPSQAVQASTGSSVHLPLQCQDASMGNSGTSKCMPICSQTKNASVASFMSVPSQVDTTGIRNITHLPMQTPSNDSNKALEPDLELLAVLLKNPDLVFTLTAGQASGVSETQVVALLDLLKKGGAGLNGISNQLAGNPIRRPEITRLPSPTLPETVPSELNLGRKTITTRLVPQSHLPGSSRDPTIIYAMDAQLPPYLAQTTAMPMVQRDSFAGSLPPLSHKSAGLLSQLSSNYDIPTLQTPSTNVSHNEPKLLAPQSIAHIPASGNASNEYAASSVPFHTPNVVAASSSPYVGLTSITTGSSLQGASDFRLTNHSNSQPLTCPPPARTFRIDRPAIQRPSRFAEHPTIGASHHQPFPASGRMQRAVPPMDEHFPSSSTDGAADFEETRFSTRGRGRHYDRDRFASWLSRSPPANKRSVGASTNYAFDDFRRDRDGAMPRPIRYLDDDYDDCRVQPGRKVSGWEDDRRSDWGRSRHSDYSQHNPGKRWRRERDRRY